MNRIFFWGLRGYSSSLKESRHLYQGWVQIKLYFIGDSISKILCIYKIDKSIM